MPVSVVLVTRENCPDCRALRRALDAAGAPYDVLDGDAPDGLALMAWHGRMGVPLLVDSGDVVVDVGAWLAKRAGEEKGE